MIELQYVHFAYTPGEDVLSGVDLEIGPGLTLVLGPNGCGKSTLLKIAAGVERPALGQVSIAGHDLWRDEVAARRHLAYLPEHPDLTPYATVSEVLQLVCALRGLARAGAAEALAWAGLANLGQRTVRELSKGQRRRAVLAASRIGSPRYLVLDEPLEGMDRAFRGKQLDWLQELLAASAVILLVSHELEAFSDLADRAVSLHNGRCTLYQDLPEPGPERLDLLENLARGLSRA